MVEDDEFQARVPEQFQTLVALPPAAPALVAEGPMLQCEIQERAVPEANVEPAFQHREDGGAVWGRPPAHQGGGPPGPEPSPGSAALVLLEDEDRVMPAESERVGHRRAHRRRPRSVWDVVEGAVGIRGLVVDGRG